MLTELASQDTNSESLVNTSITFETRSKLDSTIKKREYIFSYSKEFNEWHFHKYIEYRSPDKHPRNFVPINETIWNSAEGIRFVVPESVLSQLKPIIGKEQIDKFI